MIIGVPKELKQAETRVGITPAGVRSLVGQGHRLLVEADAGLDSAMLDAEYIAAGAEILADAGSVWNEAEMIVKVKEPIPGEYKYFRQGLLLFTYLHLAPLPELTNALLNSRVTSIAYETIRNRMGSLPLLTPMSEVAGRIAVQVGATYLQRSNGGRGLLLGGVPGVPPARVCIVGGGVVGTNAAKVALGMGAEVVILDQNIDRLRYLDDIFNGHVHTAFSNQYTLERETAAADLVLGGVLIPGAAAPKLVTRSMVTAMRAGSVIVDVAIDQGGCIETSRPTTHAEPVYFDSGVLHYCVTNMPAAVPNTSTLALTNATLPFAMELARAGAEKALSGRLSVELEGGFNTYNGSLTCKAVAEGQKRSWTSIQQIMEA